METTTSTTPPEPHTQRDRSALVARLQVSDIFREYQLAFQSITGLPLALRPAGSFQPPMQGTKQANAFCILMAGKNKTCAACLEVQQRLETAACDKSATADCFAGLTESAVPIRVGDFVVAYLQTGQVLMRQPSRVQFGKVARHLAGLERDVDIKALEEAFFQTRVVPKNQYESILRLLEIFALQLSTLSNQLMVKQALAEAPAITRARAFIAEHLTEDLSLEQVSRAVGMSSFYFCKNFKKGTGLTFTDYLSRVRVEAVKQLLLNPHKRVSEAAYEAGFQSLSQFNRVFHRIAGQPPSIYRERLHAPERGHGGPHVHVQAA